MPEETKNLKTAGRYASGASVSRRKKPGILARICAFFFSTVLLLLCIAITASLLGKMILNSGAGGTGTGTNVSDVTIMDKFDMFMTNEISGALDGIVKIEKVYWLSDSDLVAPKPNPANYGTADSPAELMWLLEEAKDLIDGQEMLFNENTPVWEGDKIYYYYDETILVITWKQSIRHVCYTISEVKIAHPSQFRRFLANGEFGSDKQYVTTDMAKAVNSVVATSGDFYKHRYFGVVVYENEIKRSEFDTADTCFINDAGDLLFAPRHTFKNQDEAQKFVEDNNVRFSLAFGPILIENGVACPPASYPLGEIHGTYTRAAICQRDDLHYMIVNACGDGPENWHRHTIAEFARELEIMGCDKAYALDGGQTTVITMDGELISHPDFSEQRQISDIIYFATALPDGE